jgi:hypothetical protein
MVGWNDIRVDVWRDGGLVNEDVNWEWDVVCWAYIDEDYMRKVEE